MIAPGADHIGEVQAWNVDTGKRVWTHKFAELDELGTDAGHRRRAGVQRRHQRSDVPRLRCGHRQSAVGDSQTQSGIIGQPSSFMVDGTQYIAVQSGWGIDARSMQGRLEGHQAR